MGDHHTTADNDTVHVLRRQLAFNLGAAPEPAWSALEPIAPVLSVPDSVLLAQMSRTPGRHDQQPRLALRRRLDEGGDNRADTTLVREGHRPRVRLVRVDTTASRWLF